MLIKYTGGRSRYLISYNRKPYHFTPENNHILDIQEKEVVNYIFSLPNREFEAVMVEVKPEIPEIKKEEIIVKPEIKKEEKKNVPKRKKHK